ncbi:MAG: DUF2141 domain-containing protein [Pseudomonadales bacterium]
MNKRTKTSAAFLLGVASALGAQMASSADLTVEIADIRNHQGSLQVGVFDNEKAYKSADAKDAFASLSLSITGKQAAFTLHGMPAGTYAVSLFHDENENYDLELEGGIPVEGYAVSNASDRYDDPSFEKASIDLGDKSQVVAVKMYYLD